MTELAPRLQGRSRPRRRRVGPVGWAVALFAVGLITMAGLPLLLSALRADALAGTSLLGVDIGGLDGAELEAAVAEIAADRGADPLHVERGVVDGRDSGQERVVEATAADAGYVLDVDLTVAVIRSRGRQANPMEALAEHWRSWREGITITPVEGIDADGLEQWADTTARELSAEAIEGEVALDGTTVVRTDPEPGMVVDADRLAAEAGQAAMTEGPSTIVAELEPVQPESTSEAVDEAVALLERALDGPVRLERFDGAIELGPEQLASVFDVERDGEAFHVSASAEQLDDLVDDAARDPVERDPIDAEIRLDGGTIVIDESRDGFRFDPEAAAEQLLAIAHGDEERTATLEGEVVRPDRSTEDAEELGIVEEVSSFTTEFQPGQSRVTNIQRIADLIDGVVLEPGDTFSVNDHVGRRTEERGFVGGGAILRGEFVEQIGGGVSQFATTMYNAAYFGGYEILEHQAHSYYIERYPAGREATLNYPTIDLKIRNNSPHGLLIETSHTDSSVTVTMWGTEWVEVESVAEDRTRIREGELRDGFDITVTRVLRFPDGRVEREPQFTRYLPEDEPDD